MNLIIYLAIFIFFICWMLFAPLRLTINTSNNNYSFRWIGILLIKFIPDSEELIIFRFRIFFIRFNIYPLKTGKKKKMKKKKPKKKKSFSFEKFRLLIKIVWNVILSSKLKIFELNIDTDDVVKNSYLIPVFINLNTRNNINLNVNYHGRQSLVTEFQNTAYRMIKVALITLIKHKFKS